eukprot:gene7366-7577_t
MAEVKNQAAMGPTGTAARRRSLDAISEGSPAARVCDPPLSPGNSTQQASKKQSGNGSTTSSSTAGNGGSTDPRRHSFCYPPPHRMSVDGPSSRRSLDLGGSSGSSTVRRVPWVALAQVNEGCPSLPGQQPSGAAKDGAAPARVNPASVRSADVASSSLFGSSSSSRRNSGSSSRSVFSQSALYADNSGAPAGAPAARPKATSRDAFWEGSAVTINTRLAPLTTAGSSGIDVSSYAAGRCSIDIGSLPARRCSVEMGNPSLTSGASTFLAPAAALGPSAGRAGPSRRGSFQLNNRVNCSTAMDLCYDTCSSMTSTACSSPDMTSYPVSASLVAAGSPLSLMGQGLGPACGNAWPAMSAAAGLMAADPDQMMMDQEAAQGLKMVEQELQRLLLLKQQLAASKTAAAMSNNSLALAACDAAASMHQDTLEQALAIKAALECSNQLPMAASSAMPVAPSPVGDVFGAGSPMANAGFMGSAGRFMGAVGECGMASGQLELQVAAQMKLGELMAVQEKQMLLQQELMTLLPLMAANMPN